jgi:hypothetical protein
MKVHIHTANIKIYDHTNKGRESLYMYFLSNIIHDLGF